MRKRNGLAIAFTIATLLLVGADRIVAQKGYDTFQKALAAEKGEGNLQAAIKLYQQVIKEAGSDTSLAARAWLRLGDCYQRLGDVQARDAFSHVLKQFADQTDAVAQARDRLAALGPAPVRGVTARLVGVQNGQIGFQGPITDGQLGGTDWANGDVVLRDLTTGQLRRLVKGGGSQLVESSWGEDPLVSPDRSLIAYQWFGEQMSESHQLRLVSTQPGAKPRVLIGDVERIHNPYPIAWSRDGRSLLVGLELTTPTVGRGDFQFAWASVADGSLRPIRTVEFWRSGGNSLNFVNLSPDQRFIVYSARPAPESQDSSIFVVPTTGSAPVEVVKGGVNTSPAWSPDGASLLFVSNRGGTYGLWSVPVRDGIANGPIALVKSTIGRVDLHGITPSGSLYYTQDAGVDEVFVAAITADGRVTANARPIDATTGRLPSWSRDGRQLVLKRRRGDETHDIVVRTVGSGEERKGTFRAAAGGRPMWVADGVIQPAAGSRVRLRSDQNDLPQVTTDSALPLGVLSPDGALIYAPAPPMSANRIRNSRIVGYDATTGQERRVIDVPTGVIGFALNSAGTQFAVASTGSVWVIGADGIGYRELYKGNRIQMNPHRVGWSPDGRFVLFTEQDPQGRNRLMRIPVSGGTPEPAGIEVDELSAFDISPDGTRIAYSARRSVTEIWALELGSMLPRK
jgi:Tol biopolymer transport system component